MDHGLADAYQALGQLIDEESRIANAATLSVAYDVLEKFSTTLTGFYSMSFRNRYAILLRVSATQDAKADIASVRGLLVAGSEQASTLASTPILPITRYMRTII
jgi:hypothetical protein